MMRPVILSMPVNSATGLVTRSAEAEPATKTPAARSAIRAIFVLIIRLPGGPLSRNAAAWRTLRGWALQAGTHKLWRQKSDGGSAARRPGVVVASDTRPLLVGQHRAFRPISPCAAGEIRLVRLLPVARLVVFLRRRRVDAVV